MDPDNFHKQVRVHYLIMIEFMVLSFLLIMRYGFVHSKVILPVCWCELVRRSLSYFYGVRFIDSFYCRVKATFWTWENSLCYWSQSIVAKDRSQGLSSQWFMRLKDLKDCVAMMTLLVNLNMCRSERTM